MSKNINNFFKKIKVLNKLKDGDIVYIDYELYIFKCLSIHYDGFIMSVYLHNNKFQISEKKINFNNYGNIYTEEEYINKEEYMENMLINEKEEKKLEVARFRKLCKNKYKELQDKYNEHIKELEFINNI